MIFTECQDLYMFGWNESGQLAQPTNLARPAECFSAVEVRKNPVLRGGNKKEVQKDLQISLDMSTPESGRTQDV